jgi:hypothetical protein
LKLLCSGQSPRLTLGHRVDPSAREDGARVTIIMTRVAPARMEMPVIERIEIAAPPASSAE